MPRSSHFSYPEKTEVYICNRLFGPRHLWYGEYAYTLIFEAFNSYESGDSVGAVIWIITSVEHGLPCGIQVADRAIKSILLARH